VGAQDLPLPVDEDVGVVNRPQGLRDPLIDPHDHVGVHLPGVFADPVHGRAGDFHGILDQLQKILMSPVGIVQATPPGVGRDVNFGKSDELGSLSRGFFDQTPGFFDRRLPVQENGGSLDGCGLELWKSISHG
jgi:hypothetical protein